MKLSNLGRKNIQASNPNNLLNEINGIDNYDEWFKGLILRYKDVINTTDIAHFVYSFYTEDKDRETKYTDESFVIKSETVSKLERSLSVYFVL